MTPSTRSATVSTEQSALGDVYRREIADQARLAHKPTHSRTREPYQTRIRDKWWSGGFPQCDKRNHIGRIMETELGLQLHGDARCEQCKNQDLECWIYSPVAKRQVHYPGGQCARCRSSFKACTVYEHSQHGKRRKKAKARSPLRERPVNVQRPLAPAPPHTETSRDEQGNGTAEEVAVLKQEDVEVVELESDSDDNTNTQPKAEGRSWSIGSRDNSMATDRVTGIPISGNSDGWHDNLVVAADDNQHDDVTYGIASTQGDEIHLPSPDREDSASRSIHELENEDTPSHCNSIDGSTLRSINTMVS
ncbi:hypothetical protein HDK77DRAFT_97441 [Phyllosticta capitalensis]